MNTCRYRGSAQLCLLVSLRPSSVFSAETHGPLPVLCRVLKLLSEDPGNYADAPREGIRRVLEEVIGKPHPRDKPLDTTNIASIRMGTTVRLHTSPASHAAEPPTAALAWA
jgi:hypothetical protein